VAAGAGTDVWMPAVDDPLKTTRGHGPGRPVAVGPVGADPAPALAALTELVAVAGVEAAGAGVDLGSGFRSARLDGARGDRRDAVLAALRAIGPERLGERAAVVVALFGPGATKPVGAAAGRAVDEGRWAAVHLASAASDLLGPEQLEQVLGWAAEPGTDPVPHGRPSDLARHLAVVLGPVAPPRRPRILRSLWDHVSAHQVTQVDHARLKAGQSPTDLVPELAARRQAHLDDRLLHEIRGHYRREPTLAEAARWVPTVDDRADTLRDTMKDALAATVLLRTAAAVARDGPAGGLAAARPLLKYGANLLNAAARRTAAAGDGHPARPGCYVHALWQALAGRPGRAAAVAAEVLPTARDYGLVTFAAAESLFQETYYARFDPRWNALSTWATQPMRAWRRAAGYHRDPATWNQAPMFHDLLDLAPLNDRLAAPPATAEVAADMLWHADLGDALALLHGHERAEYWSNVWGPTVLPEGRPNDDPLRQVLTSVPLAVAGAAQLVSIGGRVPERCGTWAELVDGLLATEALAEARTGPFVLPDPFPDLDGTTVPGTDLRVELARDGTTLARWANRMGNCIAAAHYVDGAQQGRQVLVALVGPDGRPTANVELDRTGTGWRMYALAGRFNADPDPALADAVKRWAAGIPTDTSEPAPAAFNARDNRVDPHGGRGPSEPPARDAERIRAARPRPLAHRMLDDAAGPLGDLVTAALATPAVRESLAVVTALAGRGTADPLTDLRRAADDRLTTVVRTAIGRAGGTPVRAREHPAGPVRAGERAHVGHLGFAALWSATDARPLATAVAALPEELRDRYRALARLTGDDELPRSLRTLVRSPKIAPGHALDAVNARLRAAIGRLARAGDPALARAVAAEATTPALCALVTAVSLWAGDGNGRSVAEGGDGNGDVVRVLPPGKVRVPGYPASALDDPDGPWRRAWPAARELGAPVDEFRERIAVTGLVVPAGWLAGADWTVLWRRAAARTRPVQVL
jgi:hypothetical protein